MQNLCDIRLFIGSYFICQHIYLCVKHVFNAWYSCVKCTKLWMNEFYTIFIINLSYVKFVMWIKTKHSHFTWCLQAKFEPMTTGITIIVHKIICFLNVTKLKCWLLMIQNMTQLQTSRNLGSKQKIKKNNVQKTLRKNTNELQNKKHHMFCNLKSPKVIWKLTTWIYILNIK